MSRRPGRPLVLPLHALLELLEHLSVALGLLLFVKLFQILLGVVLKVGFVNYVVTLGVALVLLRLIVEEVVVLILFCLFAFSPEVYGPEILFLPILFRFLNVFDFWYSFNLIIKSCQRSDNDLIGNFIS